MLGSGGTHENTQHTVGGAMEPGSIVRCRNRDWVLLPSEDDSLLWLRPLAGTHDDAVALHKGLMEAVSYSFQEERVQPSTFPLPTAEDVADVTSAHLL